MIVAVTIATVALATTGAVVAVKLTGKPSPTPTTSITPTTTPSTTTPPTPTPTGPTAQNEADAINNLLPLTAASRTKLVNAVAAVSGCSDVPGAVSQIQQSASARQGELNTAEGLQVGKLPNGSTLKYDLVQALQYSLTADNDYLSWAESQESSCTGVSPSNVTPANDEATQYKTEFSNLWNQIAFRYGESDASPTSM
jgi:hypothetical protein